MPAPGEKASGAPDVPDHPKVYKFDYLINKINFLNFQERALLVSLEHAKYKQTILLYARPEPCQDGVLRCTWEKRAIAGRQLHRYRFQSILVPDGQKLLHAQPKLLQVDAQGFVCELPEICYEISSRKISRYACPAIEAVVFQAGAVFKGRLIDFNASSLRVEVKVTPPQTFQWLNREETVTLVLENSAAETIYSGECHIRRSGLGRRKRTFILEPTHHHIHRFKKEKYRSRRQQIVPAPDVSFRHPLTGHMISRKVADLSGSGFAIEETASAALILPGMIIPELEFNFANTSKVSCRAQVVYRRIIEDDPRGAMALCGIAILDMDHSDNIRYLSLLHQVRDRHAYMCNKVDMDALWEFFFETGFIYPDKYGLIERNKETIKATYAKLYTRHPNIARHFIYQDKGRILAHLSTIRFYQNAWLIHHHAARKSVSYKAGLVVLSQIGDFTYDSHRLYSMHMDFLFCYYQPEKKFPKRVFGGVARHIDDRKSCSTDAFAYFSYRRSRKARGTNGNPLDIEPIQPEDLTELASFYQHTADGLTLHALDLEPSVVGPTDELSSEYKRLGFKRERRLFAFKKRGSLKAIVQLNISDLGLNLSNLTNCIHIFVLDPFDFKLDDLDRALWLVLQKTGQGQMPVLLYPAEYARQQGIGSDKLYHLWVLDTKYSDKYFSYVKRLLKFIER